MKKVEKEFADLVTMVEIGRTYQNQPIQALEVNFLNASNPHKKGILITGAHHSRELTSISMNLYLLLKVCYGYKIRDQQTMSLLNSSILYFVPVVNVDGFKHISDEYLKTSNLLYIRKNRNDGRKEGTKACQDDEYMGVDLNRNYDFKFGANDKGSSGDKCSEDYRGQYAFSEPETAALRDFIENKKDIIAMAFNFHAYGNLLIYPFNYDPSPSNNELY
jgi:murein tripeptide amidase MpaA